MIKSVLIGWAYVGDIRNAQKILVEEPKDVDERIILKWILKEVGFEV
jgi:hypothetical protein